MTVAEIMAELEAKGSDNIKKILLKHGVKEPFFGVKIEFLKPIEKKVKKNYEISMGLYATGNADAMYLAGLVADETKMTEADFELWQSTARSQNIIEYTVPWIASESPLGWELGLKWIESEAVDTRTIGWSTLGNVLSLRPDESLDMERIRSLVDRILSQIHSEENRVKLKMNEFIIQLGIYVLPLQALALEAATKIGKVSADMGDTACKIPLATEYIQKAIDKGKVGKKKKMARC